MNGKSLLAMWIAGGIFTAVSFGGAVVTVAQSPSRLYVDKAAVEGNANLASGAEIQTSRSSATLRWLSGPTAELGKESRARVFDNRMLLEQGAVRVGRNSRLTVEALGLRVNPESGAMATVEVRANDVVVAADGGAVRVSREGVPVATLTAGRALSLQPSAGASPTSTMQGRVMREGKQVTLADEISGLRVMLEGNALDREVGHRVSVTGKARLADGTQTVEVAKLTRLPDEPGSPVPAGSPSPSPNVPQAGGGGESAGVVVGVLVLMATAAALGVYFTVGQPDRVSR